MLNIADNPVIFIREDDEMAIDEELESYLERLAGVLDHADRRTVLMCAYQSRASLPDHQEFVGLC